MVQPGWVWFGRPLSGELLAQLRLQVSCMPTLQPAALVIEDLFGAMALGFCLLSPLSAGVFLIAQDWDHGWKTWAIATETQAWAYYTDWLFRNEEPCNWIGSSMIPCSRAQNACGAFGAWLEGFQFPVRAISLEGPPPCFRWRSACDSESQKWGWIRRRTALLFNWVCNRLRLDWLGMPCKKKLIWGRWTQFDKYFSNLLKPPTSY